MDKLGVKNAMICGLLCFGLGGVASMFADSYGLIFTARFFVGLGFGICLPIAGVIVASWFNAREQQYMNAVIIIVSYVGMVLAYTITLPVNTLTGSWQMTLTVIGAYVIFVAFLWLILAKNKPLPETVERQIEVNVAEPVKYESGLLQAARHREVWLLALMLLGVMWTFNTFTTYLTLFFVEERGMDNVSASAITGYLPLAGIIGGLFCGVASGRFGLRKPFTWPLFLLMMVGVMGSVIIPSGPLLYLAVGLLGFGAAGFSPIFFQVPMELEGANPEMVGGALAIIIGTSYILSYFAPLAFGFVSSLIPLSSTLLIFGTSLVLSLGAGLAIKETGWRNKQILVTPA